MTERAAYRLSEVCDMLGIERTTLWRLERAGKITVDRTLGFPLVPAWSLQAFLHASGRETSSNILKHPATSRQKKRNVFGKSAT
jgi:hypothetical protein